MARTHEDIERYILTSGIEYDQPGSGTWVLRDSSWGGAQIVVHHDEPLVIFRVKLIDLPADLAQAVELTMLRRLLTLNATEMLQGAYALEGRSVVAVEVMQAENLDQNEFLAAVDTLTLAVEEHRDEFGRLLQS